jgi:(S)-ureidoglycine aminohydrolase
MLHYNKKEISMQLPRLTTRAKVKRGAYALLELGGFVTNRIPQMLSCAVYILASRELGAKFVQYYVQIPAGADTNDCFAKGENDELFLYMLEGSCMLETNGKAFHATENTYLYVPPSDGLSFQNESDAPAVFLLYKQKYIPLIGAEKPARIFQHVDDVKREISEHNPHSE